MQDPAVTLQALADPAAARDQLLPRAGLAPPQLLWLTIIAARHGSDEQVAQLLTLPAVLGRALAGEPVNWPEAESPAEQLDRALRGLLRGLRSQAPELVPALPPGEAGRRLDMQQQWLLNAAQPMLHAGLAPANVVAPAGALGTGSAGGPIAEHCRLPALLLADGSAGTRGQLAQITLFKVSKPGAHLRMAAAPSSALTPCSSSFLRALDDVTTFLRGQFNDAEAQHLALAWDIAPVGGVLRALDGPSAGAALALGALWLLRHLLPEGHAWRRPLMRLQRADLLDVHVTAQLLPDGRLATVHGEDDKALALQACVQAGLQSVRVYVASPDDTAPAPVARHNALYDLHQVTDLHELVNTLAQRARDHLTPAQETLLAALLQRDPLHQHPPQPDLNVLTEVADSAPVRSLVQYALQRWAHWARQQKGQWQNRFVPLDMVPAQDAGLPVSMAPRAGAYSSLAQLLHENRHLRLHAYLLRGQSGAGKTTLLQHMEQHLCRRALQNWEDGLPMAELPLYLPLSQLPAEGDGAEPMQWLRQQFTLSPRYRHCSELHGLLQPGHSGPTGLRVLLDGLNELPVPAHGDRNQRAQQLLHSVSQALPGLSLLLGSRTHHSFDFSLAPFELLVAPVDVQPWGEAAVKNYIHRRFSDQASANSRWQALQAQPHVYALCQTPFNLAGQCDLWQAGHDHLASDRADLYGRLLWRLLVRELHIAANSKEHPLNDLALLSRADRQTLLHTQALAGKRLPPWPTEGQLLPALFRQAQAQWWQAADTRPDLPAGQRGEVEVAWDDDDDPDRGQAQRRSVVHWLAQALRQRWRSALHTLNLLDDFQPLAHRGQPDGAKARDSFKFRHQSWGEYLASVTLLPARPGLLPAAEQARLHQVLSAPRVQQATAGLALAAQRQAVRERWAGLSQDLRDTWLKDGIAVNRELAWQRMLEHYKGNAESLRRDWDYLCANDLFEDVPGRPTVVASVRGWVALTGICQALGLSDRDWPQAPEAWQMLVMDKLWPPFREEVWRLLGPTQARQLQAQPAGLQLPGAGDLDEVLGLALLGHARPEPWLQALCLAGHWQALAPTLPALARRLEPQGAWPLPGQPAPHAGLQHLRRVLLLRSVDAGAAVRQRVHDSGLWALLCAAPTNQNAELQAHWQQECEQAFCGAGRDLRARLQAALLLGELGDNLRYQPGLAVGADGQPWPGLRLHPALWARLPPGRYRLGSDDEDPLADEDEKPCFSPRLRQAFDFARLPVTVGEWQRFVDAGGYDPNARWWQADGSLGVADSPALTWLKHQADQLPKGQAVRPNGWGHSTLSNPLQAVAGISWFEAMAYARWAAPMYADLQAAEALAGQPELHLQLPTEGLWEAGVRGSAGAGGLQLRWPHATPAEGPAALDFNHDRTRWGRPSPVGVFSLGWTASGAADAAGNVWQWCRNALSAELASQGYQTPQARGAALHPGETTEGAGAGTSTEMALRGGSCGSATDDCRIAYRDRSHPGRVGNVIGLRLVRCVLPHSEHWTLDT